MKKISFIEMLPYFMSIILSIILIITGVNYLKVKDDMKKLQAEYDELQTLYDECKTQNYSEDLDPCPICGASVKLFPINESFYICCENCNLRTDYFDSRKDLIDYWNKKHNEDC